MRPRRRNRSRTRSHCGSRRPDGHRNCASATSIGSASARRRTRAARVSICSWEISGEMRRRD
jgi:hypothetical protein